MLGVQDVEKHSSNLESHTETKDQMIEEDSASNRKKRYIFWLYIAGITIYAGLMLWLLAQQLSDYQSFMSSDSFYFSNQVASDWSTGFIEDILVSQSACPTNYEPAFKYNWPGYGYGCNCQGSSDFTFVLNGYCIPSLIQSNCSNMPAKAGILASKWTNKALICVKRSASSFLNQPRYNGSNKICGSSSSLTIIAPGKPCPIVSASYTAPINQAYVAIGTDSLRKLKAIYTVTNATSAVNFKRYPIVRMTVSQFQLCQINEDSGISPEHSDFILINATRGCPKVGNFTEFDKTTEDVFFANNPELNALKDIKGFPAFGNWDYKLGYRAVPSWTYQCRHNLNGRFSIPNARSMFNADFDDIFQNMGRAQIFFSVLLIVEVFICGLRRSVNGVVYPIGYRQVYMPGHFLTAAFRYFLDFICKFSLLGLSFGMIWVSYTSWNWYKAAINFDCVDGNVDMIQSILIPFQKMHYDSFRYYASQFALTIVMLVVDVIHFVYIYRVELSKYLIENQKQQLILKLEDDLKWAEQVEAVPAEDEIQGNNDEMRITMAQNLFNDPPETELPSKKLKRKKKKTFAVRQPQLIEQDSLAPITMDPSFDPLFQDEYPSDSKQTPITPIAKGRRRRN